MKFAIQAVMQEFNLEMNNVTIEDVDFKYDSIIKTYNDLVKDAYE